MDCDHCGASGRVSASQVCPSCNGRRVIDEDTFHPPKGEAVIVWGVAVLLFWMLVAGFAVGFSKGCE